jgi:hypothetical protein
VISAVPGATAVTIPPLLTVAIAILEEVHGFVAAGVPDPDKVLVLFKQMVVLPEIVGIAFTVNIIEA